MSDVVKRALVAGHADFAAGLIGAVEMISGCGNVLIPIQVRGLCAMTRASRTTCA
jgi:mannose/fructose-specific phosphotransferase system component IIA